MFDLKSLYSERESELSLHGPSNYIHKRHVYCLNCALFSKIQFRTSYQANAATLDKF